MNPPLEAISYLPGQINKEGSYRTNPVGAGEEKPQQIA
jgi:hypothetical protein